MAQLEQNTPAKPRSESTGVRRVKRRKREGSSHDEPHFLRKHGITLAMIVMGVISLIFFVNPFKGYATSIEPRGIDPVWYNFWNWIAFGNGFLFFGLLTFAGFLFFSGLRIRQIASNNSAYWCSACPNCDNKELKRTPRKWHTNLLGSAFRLPVRHYICPECSWRGNRVDYTKLTG